MFPFKLPAMPKLESGNHRIYSLVDTMRKSASLFDRLCCLFIRPPENMMVVPMNGGYFFMTMDGNLHREDGPCVYHRNGKCWMWLYNGFLHREGGPAQTWENGNEEWYIHGRHHRLDGPAIVDVVHSFKGWFINGHIITGKIHDWASNIGIDLNNLTEDDKAIIVMVWGDYNE